MSKNINLFDRSYSNIFRTNGVDNTIKLFIDKFCDTDEYVDENDFIIMYTKLLDAIYSDVHIFDLLKDIHICVYDNYCLIKKIIEITMLTKNLTYSDFIEIHFYDEEKKIFDYFIEKSILSNITPTAYHILYTSGKISLDTHSKMIQNKKIANCFFVRCLESGNIDNVVDLICAGYIPSACIWSTITDIIYQLNDDDLTKLFDSVIENNIMTEYILITFIETKYIYVIEKLVEKDIDIENILSQTKLSDRDITLIKKLIEKIS